MKMSISINAIAELFNHYYWTRDRQLQICATLTNEQFLKPMGSSFSSLRDTLMHMVAVESLWLQRWRGESPQYQFEPEKYPNVVSVKEYWQSIEKETRAFLASLNGPVIEKTIVCVSSRGQTWNQPLWRFMLHLIIHQSHHRGQVTTMLRQMGVQPARVDFMDAFDAGFKA